MKRNSTFLESVLEVSYRKRTRQFILPLLIFITAAFFIFSLAKDAQLSKAQFEADVLRQQELILKSAVQSVERALFEKAIEIENAVNNDKKLNTAVFSEFLAVDSKLEDLAFFQQHNTIQEACANYIEQLKQKSDLEKKIFNALQSGNLQQASVLLNSPVYKQNEEVLRKTQPEIESLVANMPEDILPVVTSEGNQQFSWNIFIYISGAILFLLIWIYLYIKSKQNKESEQKMRASAEVKENFLANMSHEIRTPLNAVLGFTNILKNTNLNVEQKEYIDVIQTSGDNLLSIVNDILDLSKIEAGMLRIEESPFRIKDIIATVESMFQAKAEEKNLKLVVNIDSDTPEIVSGDAVRLTQILVNLVANAIKFTEDGGIYLRVTPLRKDNDKIILELLVRDTGIGISAEKQMAIFDRFEQAEASTTRRFGGTGLGLSIVKNLVELQHGTIELYSQHGMGTSFTIEIPYKMTNEKVMKADTKKISLNPTNMKTDVKILIAEDNVMNQRLIKHLMNNWRFNYDLVFNGAQALEAIKKQSYDIILMDIQMPEMDGYTATAFIRSEIKSNIPIIAMTAHAMAGEKEKCIKAGMDDYLSKPINEEMLYEMIEKYAAKKSGNLPSENKNEITNLVTDKGGKVIDLNVIEKYSKGNIEFRNELIQEFITTVPSAINSLESAIKDQNFTRIKEIAHDMKTTIHIMGLTMLIGHLLQKIEAIANTNSSLASIYQIFTDVRMICLQAVQEAGRLVA